MAPDMEARGSHNPVAKEYEGRDGQTVKRKKKKRGNRKNGRQKEKERKK